MRLVIFSLIDDWDVGPLLDRSGHHVAAWVKPEWHPKVTRSPQSRGIRRILKVLLAQDHPFGNLEPSYDVREWLAATRIPMISCPDANTVAFRDTLQRLKADLFVVAAYPQILSRSVLDIPPMGVINYHPSLLPAYAGAQPGFWVLRNDEKETGITVHRMTETIDAGDILAQEVVSIEQRDNLGRLMQRLHHQAAHLIVRTVDAIADGTVSSRSQQVERRSYFRKKSAGDLEIDWTQPRDKLLNLLRAVQPFEPLTTRLHGRRVLIFDAVAEDAAQLGKPGEIVQESGEHVFVQTGTRTLKITAYEISPFHGWLNKLVKRILIIKGERFEPSAQASEKDQSGGKG